MTNRTLALVLAAAAAGLAVAPPMSAQARDYQRYGDDCTQRIHNNGTAGAVVGGLAGAVIGSNLASHRNHTEGALLGAAAGAAVGNNIARSSTKDRCRGSETRVYYRPPPPPPPVVHYVPAPPPPPVVYHVVEPPPPPVYVYERDEHHDNGRHLGWYKHHGHHDDDDD